MSDKLNAQPFDVLLRWILQELEACGSIFGIHRSLFYTPRPDSPYASQIFGQHLATPVGPAAGPHTQLAQNIIAAWLSGGRFIELKTVQILDELEIPRPCIDMEDEGYNVEWSQELRLEQSAREYIHAWVLIHVLHRLLGFEGRAPVGTVFNMSVGYNLAGIQSLPMVRFMDLLQDASAQVAEIQSLIPPHLLPDSPIPATITNSVTLSTMHGCPPDEIEAIARYMLAERGLHTSVKLNPTLLGKEAILRILHDDLGYREIRIPDSVFEHDLKYDRAVELIRTLNRVAAGLGLSFGVKLSNTLAMANHKGYLPGAEMYMSGRALYPITMTLFHRLMEEFDGNLSVSYSAGADALNVTAILAAGARPVTAASDLLKPGGYTRMLQWLENLEAAMQARGARSLDEFARDRLANVARAAAEARQHARYKKSYFPHGLPKVDSRLELFDCIAAPCIERCAVCQDVPEYAWWIAHGDCDAALSVILHRNPLPGVTGYACTHLCQTRCTRNNYDQPVAIRNLKRFAFEHGRAHNTAAGIQAAGTRSDSAQAPRVAVIGSGPSGLSAAYFLALSGMKVTIFEAREAPGGMLTIAPRFRLPAEVIRADIERILQLGVELRLNHRVSVPPQDLLRQGFDAVYVACGFERDATLNIEGIGSKGVFPALRFLEQVARGQAPDLGRRVLVIGGGNTALDAARTAQRLTGQPVTVVYRRTQAEMPAEQEELRDLFAEGNRLIELATPVRVIASDGRVAALECLRNRLGEPDADGRPRPVPVPGSQFQLEADSIIVAIGQRPDIAFLDGSGIPLRKDGTIQADPETHCAGPEGVYAGGDVVRGPETIIAACADGRRAAEAICLRFGLDFSPPAARMPALTEQDILHLKRSRARKEEQRQPALLPVDLRRGFDLVEHTLSEEDAQAEAARCFQCSTLCEKCVEVCPNRANYVCRIDPVSWDLPVLTCRAGRLEVTARDAFQVRQARQIVHVDDFCNECGNCATFCVHQGKPYSDKPRLFLREADFQRETDNAFHIAGDTIWRRDRGQEARLIRQDPGFLFENAHVRLHLLAGFELEEMTLKEAFEGTLSLRAAAEMAVLLEGALKSVPFLLK